MNKLHFFQLNYGNEQTAFLSVHQLYLGQATDREMGIYRQWGGEETVLRRLHFNRAPLSIQTQRPRSRKTSPPTFNLPSVLSLAPSANVSDFIMQSVTVVRSCPDSLFSARAKAQISIECGGGTKRRTAGAFVASESLLTAPEPSG